MDSSALDETREHESAVSDPARLAAVGAAGILDTPPEEAFDRLTRIAAELINVPVAFISIVDEQRDFYKSCYGFDADLEQKREMSGTTFCHYAIASEVPLIINDTAAHPVYREVPTVRSLGVAAYVGIPLKLSSGATIGSFCVIDHKPREWSDRDVRVLSELAHSALREIELRIALRTSEDRALDAERARRLAARSEAELRDRSDLILAATADGIFGLDADGRVSFLNPAAARMLGWLPEELMGRDQHSNVHSRRADGAPYPVEECPIYQVLRDGQPRSGDGEVFVRKDGTLLPVDFTSHPILEAGRMTGAVVTFRDISQRLEGESRARALAEERAARAAAEASARALEEFFAMISHELRTPMTSIRGWTSVLRQGADEETLQMALEAIDTSSRMQAQLIDDLLDVTRMSRGKLSIDPSRIELQSVITETVSQLLPDADAHGVRIRQQLLPRDVLVYADPRRMQQVLTNILANAIKFTPRGGLVTVATACDDTHALLKVSDTGIGIEPEVLPMIFVPYRQEKNAAFGGLGLGLAIVKHLIEAAGGSVWVESEGKGKGATFFVRIPLATAE